MPHRGQHRVLGDLVELDTPNGPAAGINGLVQMPGDRLALAVWVCGQEDLLGTLGFFTQQMHIPAVLAVLAIAAEFLGAIGLLLGFLGRVAAFGIATNMVVAVILIHRHVGFFANWYGTQKGEGYEYHILAIIICLAIMIRGSGALSIDRSASRQLA